MLSPVFGYERHELRDSIHMPWHAACSPDLLRLTCFLTRMALKRSKSFKLCLLAVFALLSAYALLFHLLSTSCAFHCLVSAPVPAALGSFSRTIRVRERFERGAEWRGTIASLFSEGPSTRTYRSRVSVRLSNLRISHCLHQYSMPVFGDRDGYIHAYGR